MPILTPIMRTLLLLAAVLLPFVASAADQELKYMPAVVTVTGTLAEGKSKHPNGKWMEFSYIKLDTPAFIKGDGKEDSLDVDEKNVKEIQVSSQEDDILKKLGPLKGKKVTLTGSIFHAHTAYHVRDLVILVTAVK
jgi:hypothetical protein